MAERDSERTRSREILCQRFAPHSVRGRGVLLPHEPHLYTMCVVWVVSADSRGALGSFLGGDGCLIMGIFGVPGGGWTVVLDSCVGVRTVKKDGVEPPASRLRFHL